MTVLPPAERSGPPSSFQAGSRAPALVLPKGALLPCYQRSLFPPEDFLQRICRCDAPCFGAAKLRFLQSGTFSEPNDPPNDLWSPEATPGGHPRACVLSSQRIGATPMSTQCRFVARPRFDAREPLRGRAARLRFADLRWEAHDLAGANVPCELHTKEMGQLLLCVACRGYFAHYLVCRACGICKRCHSSGADVTSASRSAPLMRSLAQHNVCVCGTIIGSQYDRCRRCRYRVL